VETACGVDVTHVTRLRTKKAVWGLPNPGRDDGDRLGHGAALGQGDLRRSGRNTVTTLIYKPPRNIEPVTNGERRCEQIFVDGGSQIPFEGVVKADQ
jgi:hypothetical protein